MTSLIYIQNYKIGVIVMDRLKDKVAFITGGASGLGKSTAISLASEGAKIVIGDLDEAKGKQVVAEIQSSGGESLFIPLNVTNEEDWKNAIDETIGKFGKLDILVNSAGISITENIENSSIEDMNKSYAVNVVGPFLGMKESIKVMKEHGGSIINIGSMSGVLGLSKAAAYSTTKGALRLLTKSVAMHCAKSGYNIRVNNVNPSYVKTPMLEKVYSDKEIDNLKNMIPLGRLAEVSDITNNIIYLASEESSFVTGSDQNLDGGMTAGK